MRLEKTIIALNKDVNSVPVNESDEDENVMYFLFRRAPSALPLPSPSANDPRSTS